MGREQEGPRQEDVPSIHARRPWFEDIAENRQQLPTILEANRGSIVSEYTEGFWNNNQEPLRPQTRHEIVKSIREYTAPLLGTEIADLAASTVDQSGVLQTTNHGGISTWDIQVQAQIAAFLNSPYPVIVVGAGENVHFDAESSGRGGYVLSREIQAGSKRRRVFIPLFSVRRGSTLIAAAPPFGSDNIAYGIENADEFLKKGIISQKERDVVVTSLVEDCLTEDVLNQVSYSNQSVIINERIWRKRIFSKEWGRYGMDIKPLVHLGLENIVKMPLLRSCFDPESFVSQMLFTEELRDAVINQLNGEFSCWDKVKLNTLLRRDLSREERDEAIKGAHTMFFWGIDELGRGFSLAVVKEGNKAYLKRADGLQDPDSFVIPLTPRDIGENLLKNKILPSLPLVMAILTTEGGLKLLAGPNQADYHPTYQRNFAAALASTKKPLHREMGIKIVHTPIEHFSAFSALGLYMARYPNPTRTKGKFRRGIIRPAGAVEIAAGGGLRPEHLITMNAMRAELAVELGLPPSHEEKPSGIFRIAMDEARKKSIDDNDYMKDPVTGFKH